MNQIEPALRNVPQSQSSSALLTLVNQLLMHGELHAASGIGEASESIRIPIKKFEPQSSGAGMVHRSRGSREEVKRQVHFLALTSDQIIHEIDIVLNGDPEHSGIGKPVIRACLRMAEQSFSAPVSFVDQWVLGCRDDRVYCLA